MNITRWAGAAALALSALLAACGGGGGSGGDAGNEPVLSGTYSLQATSEVLVPASISATLPPGASGTPTCQLLAGTVPPGMVLGSNCSLSGAPEAMGSFVFDLRMSITGYRGSATISVEYNVGGPALIASGAWAADAMRLNETVGPAQAVTIGASVVYTPRAGDVIAFAIVAGALPPGLVLDTAAGTVSGAPTALGPFEVQIGASLTRGGKRVDLSPLRFTGSVAAPFASLRYGDGSSSEILVPLTAATVPAPQIVPALGGVASVSYAAVGPLPAGMSVDAASGVISGQPTEATSVTTTVRATVTTVGGDRFDIVSSPFTITLTGMLPFYEFGSNGSRWITLPGAYPGGIRHQANRNVPVTFAPGAVYGGQVGDASTFALQADGTPLPTWLGIAPGGTVTASVPADFTITNPELRFVVVVTTRRGGVDYTARQSWVLLLQ